MKNLIEIVNKTERIIIGVMSGTSLDGVDIALVKLKGSGNTLSIKPIAFKTYEMPVMWRNRIQKAFQADTEEICKINYDLGHFFSDQIESFLSDTDTQLVAIDAIGFHGQTLYHVHGHSTLQSGEADVLSQRLNTIVVSDFRSADVAAGGSGAPLVPYLDNALFRNDSEATALLNLGGIGNITFLPQDPGEDLLAFDTGPANGILNELTEIITHGENAYDKDGFLSQKGIQNNSLLESLLEHAYFKMPLPKSTGREQFGKNYVREILEKNPLIKPVDVLRTFVGLVSQSIIQGCNQFLPPIDRLYVSGGGAFHPQIMMDLKLHFGEEKVVPLVDKHGITAESKEAVAFALLAHERLNGTPTNIPSVTGAKKKVILGKLSIPT